MASKPPVAVYDACVLYPFHLRNLLVQFAIEGIVAARWTDEIHEEWIRNLVPRGVSRERLLLTRDLMKAALPTADVAHYDHLIPGLVLPDETDRHVLAAAVAAGASVIVTWNIRHFPMGSLNKLGIVARNPDRFLTTLARRDRSLARAVVDAARANLRLTRPSAAEYLAALEDQGLVSFVKTLRER